MARTAFFSGDSQPESSRTEKKAVKDEAYKEENKKQKKEETIEEKTEEKKKEEDFKEEEKKEERTEETKEERTEEKQEEKKEEEKEEEKEQERNEEEENGPPAGCDIFVHQSVIAGAGWRCLAPGQHVTFTCRSVCTHSALSVHTMHSLYTLCTLRNFSLFRFGTFFASKFSQHSAFVRKMEDTRQRDTLQEGLLSGGKQERWDAGHGGCRIGGMP